MWRTWVGALAIAIMPDPNAALFGDGPGTRIGSPLKYAISDPAAFLSGTGSAGERFLNEAYMREHGIYPLQVKTVWFVQRAVALAASLAALLMGAFLWFTAGSRRRLT
jgi:hypothetical protein